MAKQIETIIRRFDGGISDDIRENTSNRFAISRHFNIFDNPFRLSPYRSSKADMNDGSTATGMKQYLVRDFIFTTLNSRIYGMAQNGTGKTKIVYKAAIDDAAWTLPSSSETAENVKYGCFLEYTGTSATRLIGFTGNNVFVYNMGTPGFTNTSVGTVTTVAQGIVAKDGNAYLPYNNKIVRVGPTFTVTDAVVTLPAEYKITSIDNYGNYLAIGCSNVNQDSTSFSKVFLWDLVSSDVTEQIDWGEGALRVLANLEGRLIGISDNLLTSSLAIKNAKLVIRAWSGGTPQVVKQINSLAVGNAIRQSKAVKGNKLYFTAQLYPYSASTLEEGIWAFGRRDINSPYAVTLDYFDSNVDSDGIQSFGAIGNYFYLAHSGDGSIHRTDDAANFTTTSSYESQRFFGGDITRKKHLVKVGVGYVPLTSGQQVVLKYRKDQQTSYTTLFTRTATDEVANVDFTTVGDYNEIQFRPESTGGAEITELRFIEELQED